MAVESDEAVDKISADIERRAVHLRQLILTCYISCFREAVYSRRHPIIPRLCVPEWKKDMANRKLILQVGPLPISDKFVQGDANTGLLATSDQKVFMSLNFGKC